MIYINLSRSRFFGLFLLVFMGGLLNSCSPKLSVYSSKCNGVSSSSQYGLATVFVAAKNIKSAIKLAPEATIRSVIYKGIEENSVKMCTSRGPLVNNSDLSLKDKEILESLILSGELNNHITLLGLGFNDPRNRIIVKNQAQFGIDVRINFLDLMKNIESKGIDLSFGKLF